jgi:succinate dehydrogenase / fumarate reductase cytochrome b subunit
MSLSSTELGGQPKGTALSGGAAIKGGSLYRGGTGMLTWLAHRISGVAIVYFLTLHIFEAMQLFGGPAAYNEATAVYKQPWFRPFEWLLVMAVIYHAFNGLRVMLFDTWPQTTRYHRQIFWVGVALFIILTPIIGWAMLRSTIGLSLQQIFASTNGIGYAALIVLPVALPVLYIAWRGSGLANGPLLVSSSNSRPAPTQSTFERLAWQFMRVSGVIIVVLVGLHLYIMHFQNDITDITGQFVFNRFAADPIWVAVDLLMLFLVWLHGLNGLRIVITDYMRRGSPRRIVLYVVGAIGLIWLVAGGLVLFTLPRGLGA